MNNCEEEEEEEDEEDEEEFLSLSCPVVVVLELLMFDFVGDFVTLIRVYNGVLYCF